MKDFSIKNPDKREPSYLRLHRSKRNIDGKFNLMQFKEGDFFIAYLPEIKMSAYGDTPSEALDMLVDTLVNYLNNLMSLSRKEMESELARFGFFHGTITQKNYEYKGPYVDVKGVLQEFNLPEDTEVQVSELVG